MPDPQHSSPDSGTDGQRDAAPSVTTATIAPLPYRSRANARRWFFISLSATLAMIFILLLVLAKFPMVGLAFAANQANSNVPVSKLPPGITMIPIGSPPPTVVPAGQVLNDRAGCAKGAVKPMAQVVWRGQYGNLAAPREVALTFDDGPTPYSTPAILAYLEQSHTPATFFVEGHYAALWPQLVQREWKDGFAIGMHTWDHPNMTLLSDSGLRHQFGDTLAAVRKALGANTCLWMWRPPYGSYNGHVLAVAASFGLTTVKWDDDSRDWTTPGVWNIVNTVLAEAHPGAIILMHDGPANRAETALALSLILAGLRARGLSPVTLPQLLVDAHFPGVATTRTK